jgi:hypothetical protein
MIGTGPGIGQAIFLAAAREGERQQRLGAATVRARMGVDDPGM